jgi:hypothetical protein
MRPRLHPGPILRVAFLELLQGEQPNIVIDRALSSSTRVGLSLSSVRAIGPSRVPGSG